MRKPIGSRGNLENLEVANGSEDAAIVIAKSYLFGPKFSMSQYDKNHQLIFGLGLSSILCEEHSD